MPGSRQSTPRAADPTAPAELRLVTTPGPVIGSLCTGLAGLDLGVASVLGGRVAWYADTDPHASAILAARLPGTLNLGDLREVDFAAVEPVEVLTAGFPCQDISAAGRRAGIEKGARSGLWTHILHAIRVLRPNLVVVENVAALRWRGGGLHRVLGGLAEAQYDAVWRCVRASDIGAAHRRERVFLCAVPQQSRCAHDAHPAGPRRRTTRPSRPRNSPRGRTPGQPQRRRRLRGETTAAAANPDRGGLAVGGDPHRAEPRPPDPGRVRDADRLGPAAAHPDRLRREEPHPHRGTAAPGPSSHPPNTGQRRKVLRSNENDPGGCPYGSCQAARGSGCW